MYLLILIGIVFIFGFIVLEITSLVLNLRNDLTRKVAHVAAGAAIFFFPYFLSKVEILAILGSAAIVLLLTKLFTNAVPILKKYDFIGTFAIAPSLLEANEYATWGEVYFPIGIIISATVFLPENIAAFQFGLLILAFSDALAAIVGTIHGKHKIRVFGSTKSFEGSLSFFLTTVAITIAIILPTGKFTIAKSVGAAGALAIFEIMLAFGIDNLVLPLAASYIFATFLVV